MSEQYVSMSIASVGASTLPRQATRPFAVKETNATSDVDGAQPSKTKVWNKPDLWNNDDISGAKPMLLHRSRKSGENNSMRVDDIDGAQARIRDKMLLTKRHVDPMAPEYKLPYCKMEQAHVPKFVRDHITVSDIDKACPAPPKNYATRDPISVHDIVGAQACWRPRHEKARLEAEPHPLMDVGDICKRTHRYVDKTTRIAQVLDPSYDLYGQIIQDDPKYTKPKLLKKYIPEGHLLQTRDIPGAFTGWTKAGRERREFKNTNMTSDIEGAQSGSIKHSIVTTRSTHPLVPQYQSLDGDVLQSPVVSLLPAALIKQATLRPPPSKQIRASPTKPISDILTVEMRRGVTNDWTDSDSNNLFFSQPTARSPRSVAPLTTMDSAAYGSDRNKSNDFGASTIFLRANATPRSGRLSVKDTNIESKASPRCERTNATSRPMVAYADKFIKTESILVPAVVDDRPPLPRGKVGVPPGRGVPKDRSLIPPPLDLSLAKPSSSSNSSRSMGQASGRNSGGGSGASSARVCLVSPAKRQEAQELAESIKTIRSLQ